MSKKIPTKADLVTAADFAMSLNIQDKIKENTLKLVNDFLEQKNFINATKAQSEFLCFYIETSLKNKRQMNCYSGDTGISLSVQAEKNVSECIASIEKEFMKMVGDTDSVTGLLDARGEIDKINDILEAYDVFLSKIKSLRVHFLNFLSSNCLLEQKI